MSKTLLYLHGFRSVGLCYKGRELVSFAPSSLTPNLSYVPSLAIAYAESIIQKYGAQNLCLIGSSLGGYYATYLANKYSIKAVLVNPVINAYATLLPAIGRIVVPYSGESFFWDLSLVKSLRQYEVKSLQSELYCVLLQKGDKVLDYRIAKERFKDCQCVIEEGGSHRFENFLNQKERILAWAD
ncbi:YqiA/YcfP family alpha/beta fold hydrolase [uncultured Helicobacter sp.]|uniref:YqiA/YcfP family alpha/beta fold hydrolase n=1 Tax=uncultured Helicobacter sp. TaxID=175537 RepID=UPI00261034A4|nr:YqiA/YcfP family alpha/beta fold hydrolase [uncultured Helicobacter sp.]